MAEAKSKCLARNLSDLHDEYVKEWTDEQIVKEAYKRCEAKKDDFAEGFCPYSTLSKIEFIKGIEQQIYTNDFSSLPTSLRIANAVDKQLPKLRDDFPKKDELDILKMAYDMARAVLNNSDFETVEEQPIYFQIYIEDAELFEQELRSQALQENFDFTSDKATFFAKDQPVTSSNVAEIGYERGKLRIFFRSGGGYEYPVPSSWYTEMLNASSKGKFVWDTLRGRVPGRVIDNPSKITPGGVGGSIVPYFKIKGAAMPPDQMRQSVKSFLTSARKGRAKVSGVPIRKISKPTFKEFIRFLDTQAGRFATETKAKKKKPRIFRKITKKISTAFKKKKEKKDPSLKPDHSGIKAQIKALQKALKNARKNDLDETIIKAMERRIAALQKSMSDFMANYNIVDDFVSDMQYFSGPITRAGDFPYPDMIKTKDIDNLTHAFGEINHLPSFDSHQENSLLGFAYNFTTDPDKFMKNDPNYNNLVNKDYIFSEGYVFNDMETTTEVPFTEQTPFPVSIRFKDANEGLDLPNQDITNLIHLAISTNRTDKDRCSENGGNSCYITFQDKQARNILEHQEVNDFMPEDEKKKKEKPPKDKEKEKGEDKELKKAEKEQHKEAGVEGQEKDDFVQVKRSEITDLRQIMSDLVEKDKNRDKEVKSALQKIQDDFADKEELKLIQDDFADQEQVYKISSDFIAKADLPTMKIIKAGLIKHQEQVSGMNQLFQSDYSDDLASAKQRLAEQYKPWLKKGGK